MFTCFKFICLLENAINNPLLKSKDYDKMICLLENAINNPLLKSKDYDKMKTTNSQQKIESEC